jgi:hypothetical protein
VYVPVEHNEHVDEENALVNEPGRHAAQSETEREPMTELAEPGEHDEQYVAPVREVYVPAAQG